MMVLITYDVNTTSADGQRRLRQVAKTCEDYGQRVQNSVFECLIDSQQLKELQIKLKKTIDPEMDSLRFYRLGTNWKGKVEHVGAKQGYDPEGFLMI
ncbi:CRISPR-associated protein Cas2 [Brevibacillus parabrevis]|uniref:CRISPR-associated endonuclease Cas2 n=1 Tax=Brevibacillus parabrevis TaxID=54914 RepID=UPI0007AB7702|nr:CRISPR-associated endonuclease Cas2 [Brevibacillus parabrevis]KZE48835.1 CRISPR-associated protein Cas2 [Brevibacillus parabrevis]